MPTKSRLQQSEVRRLIIAYQKDPKNEELQTKIIANYEGLVTALSYKFARVQDTREDLYQVGMIGLIAAMQRFDPSYEHSFESFAIPTIVGEIKRYIRDKTWSVHVPRRVKELGPRIRKAADELTNRLQRSPSIEEIARQIGESEENILETMEMSRSYNALSMDSKIDAAHEGSSVTLLDVVGKRDSGYEQISEKMILQDAFKVLSPREKKILVCTFFDNLSQKETGELLGISQMHVSRLQRKALRKLREMLPRDDAGESALI